MAATCNIFEEDEVYALSDKGYKCGLVLECSEYVSSDEEDESPLDYEKVRRGTVRVAWHPGGEEEVLAEKNVGLADRSLMPGDVVRRMIEGKDSQRGYVRNTHVKCHLQILGKNKIICNVDSKELRPLSFWDTEPGDVTLDSWVGKIEHIGEDVTVKFSDGARALVSLDDFLCELTDFCDMNEKRPKDTEFCTDEFYPCQQLQGHLGELGSAKWLKSTSSHSEQAAKKHPEKEVKVTVENVEPCMIDVHWLCRGYSKLQNPLARMEPPPHCLVKEDIQRLKKLDCFEACSVQIGDKGFYTLKESDTVQSLHSKGHKSLLLHIRKGALGPDPAEGDLAKSIDTKLNMCWNKNSSLDLDKHNVDRKDDTEATKIKENDACTKDFNDSIQKLELANSITVANPDKRTSSVTCSEEINGIHSNSITNDPSQDDIDMLLESKKFSDSEYVSLSDYEEDGCMSDMESAASGHSNPSTTEKKKKGMKKGPTLQTKLLKKKKVPTATLR